MYRRRRLTLRRWRRDQRDRQRKAGGATHGRDAAAGLNGGPHVAHAIPEASDGGLQIGGTEGETPEEGGTTLALGALNRLEGLLHHLEDDRAEAEERLSWSAGRCRLLADEAKVKTGASKRSDRAIESRCDCDNVVERRDAIGVLGLLAWRRAIGA